MTVVVAIFDDAASLDRAIGKLSGQGLDETVLDPGVETPRAFKTHLADYGLPSRAMDSYMTTFAHGGKFVIIKTSKDKAAEVMALCRSFDAAQVNSHE